MSAPARLAAPGPTARGARLVRQKDGWRGMMRALSAEGRLLITNHNQPEAVILSTAEYARLLEAAGPPTRPCPTRWPNCAAASTNGWRRWTMNRPATACAT